MSLMKYALHVMLELKTVVTLFCDEGEKYLQEHFSAPAPDVVGGAFE